MEEIFKMIDSKLDKRIEEAKQASDNATKDLHSFVKLSIKQIKETCENMNTNISEKFARQDNCIVDNFSRHENLQN